MGYPQGLPQQIPAAGLHSLRRARACAEPWPFPVSQRDTSYQIDADPGFHPVVATPHSVLEETRLFPKGGCLPEQSLFKLPPLGRYAAPDRIANTIRLR